MCYFLVLIFILTKKTQRQALHNHSILVLLFIAVFIVVFDYSWTVDSSRRGGEVWPASAIFCQFWWLLDIGFYNACTVILAWASFERHILIFYSTLLSTKRRRICIHYTPLIVIPIYLLVFYTYAIFFPPCDNTYDFTSPICGESPCFFSSPLLGYWNVIFHGIIPTCLVALFNIALLVRILWQKRQRLVWKRYAKMAFQLLSISALFLSLNLPLMIITIVQLAGYPDWGVQAQLYLFFFSCLIQYFLPFVCLMSLPDIWTKIKTFLGLDCRSAVATTNIHSTVIQR